MCIRDRIKVAVDLLNASCLRRGEKEGRDCRIMHDGFGSVVINLPRGHCSFSHQHLPDRPQVLEILRREVSVCIIIGLTARRGGERKGKEEVESEYVCVEQRRRRRGGIWRGADGDWRNEGVQEREVETLAHV